MSCWARTTYCRRLLRLRMSPRYEPGTRSEPDPHHDAHCSSEGCENKFRDSGRWSHIKAVDAGWFIQKDGTKWCPDHIPEWVEEWRKKKGDAYPQKGTVVYVAKCNNCNQKIVRTPND